jgi:hypothetical protein
MKWTAATTAVKHHIYFGTSADAMTLLAVQTDTSLVMNGLHSLDTYYWRVDEEDAAGNIIKVRRGCSVLVISHSPEQRVTDAMPPVEEVEWCIM